MQKSQTPQSRYLLTHLSELQSVGIFSLKDNNVISYQKNSAHNPLHHCAELQCYLVENAEKQTVPYICKDDYQAYFVCIKAPDAYYLAGPMCTVFFNKIERHKFYRAYGIPEDAEKNLRQFTVTEILQTVCILAKIVCDAEYTDQQLLDANHLVPVTKEQETEEQILFTLKSEEEDFYRHSYQEERKLLDMVREGNVEEAVRLSKDMDAEVGKLGASELTHWRNMLVVGVTLCARAAIEGGLMPYAAYRMSGYYINKGSECKDIMQILAYRNHAIEELTKRVCELKTKRHTSSYTEQCKDYVKKHFKEKVYLDDIAGKLGISSSYLSRIFKRETGICIQDYVNDIRIERAANLLIYSEESIPRIAEYVNFPSQSYFGKIFKAKRNMTPRQYRESYKPTEFLEEK